MVLGHCIQAGLTDGFGPDQLNDVHTPGGQD